jgi:hypothetical protein
MKDQVLRQGKSLTAVFPHLCKDNPTKAARASFDLAQRSAIPICFELHAELSEYVIYCMNIF